LYLSCLVLFNTLAYWSHPQVPKTKKFFGLKTWASQLKNGQFSGVEMSDGLALKFTLFGGAAVRRKLRTDGRRYKTFCHRCR
jgi:hypothetical protein